jgi:UDP-N-acetylmuramyl pentapeptide phosphotransferase/UDP-N-acetylglucosamine-1-phosphate transferase
MQGAQFVLAIAVVASAAALSGVLIYFLKPVLVRHLLAHPNERSSHVRATPQGAGIGVMLALLIVLTAVQLWWPQAVSEPLLFPVIVAAIGLSVLGLLDDARPLPVSWRFAGQILAALVLAFSLPQDLRILPDFLPFFVERGLIAFGTVYLINAINFLDGIDWITAAQVVPMTLGVAALAYLGAVPTNVGTLALALLGAMLGFAVFNKHPAQVFLGDAGSLPIGLLLTLMLSFVAGANVTAALLLPLYTLLDSGMTLIRRSYNREHIFAAHRSHYYQRAVIAGMTPPQVTARIFVLGLLLASLAVTAVILNSTIADIMLLGFGAAATFYVLNLLARGGK